MRSAEQTVREFWRLMASNRFTDVAQVLAPEFVLEWPQSNERIRGGAQFVQMNAEYPTSGTWSFDLKRLVADTTQVVTHVGVTDGTQGAEAISFFTVVDGRITVLTEYWPEDYAPPSGRAHLTEPIVTHGG